MEKSDNFHFTKIKYFCLSKHHKYNEQNQDLEEMPLLQIDLPSLYISSIYRLTTVCHIKSYISVATQ